MGTDFYRDCDFRWNKVELSTDEGFVMEEFRKDTSLRLEFMKEQLDFRSTDMLIRFSFSLNPEKEIV